MPTTFSETPKRIAVKLKPAAERMVKKGHPWIFDRAIVKQSQEAACGDLAIIYDRKKNKFLACGLFDPHSPIRIKLLQFHRPAPIDAEWFKNKLSIAFEKRQELLQTDTNSYRFLYGENDGLPGLIADVYAQVLVLKLYSAIWLPFIDLLLPILIEFSQTKTIVLRLSRQIQPLLENSEYFDGALLYGNLDNEVVIFREHGLLFEANVIKGHKTGYFLDHRHNRKKVGELAEGARVLDVFSYAGGFSVHALQGGAKEVLSIDISSKALDMCCSNAQLNPHKGSHDTWAIDAFKALDTLQKKSEKFDIVVIDPPSFAKRESEIKGAINSYRRLAKAGLEVVEDGGWLILASCSSRVSAAVFFETIETVLFQSNKKIQINLKTAHDSDHPIAFEEGAYLKCAYYKIND